MKIKKKQNSKITNVISFFLDRMNNTIINFKQNAQRLRV